MLASSKVTLNLEWEIEAGALEIPYCGTVAVPPIGWTV